MPTFYKHNAITLVPIPMNELMEKDSFTQTGNDGLRFRKYMVSGTYKVPDTCHLLNDIF
jgi:hypothetical protein